MPSPPPVAPPVLFTAIVLRYRHISPIAIRITSSLMCYFTVHSIIYSDTPRDYWWLLQIRYAIFFSFYRSSTVLSNRPHAEMIWPCGVRSIYHDTILIFRGWFYREYKIIFVIWYRHVTNNTNIIFATEIKSHTSPRGPPDVCVSLYCILPHIIYTRERRHHKHTILGRDNIMLYDRIFYLTTYSCALCVINFKSNVTP